MKRHLNTLFIMTEGTHLAREGENVVIRHSGAVRLRVPVHTLQGIICFGRVTCSPLLMYLCAERGVAISFLSPRGRFLAWVQGRGSGNVLLRREQYRRADDPARSAAIARHIVAAKIANCRTVLQRAARDRPDAPGNAPIRQAVARLRHLLAQWERAGDVETLRGIEGDAARAYFGVFDHLITSQREDFFFEHRSRRPPLDNMNALLSFLYSVLAHDVASGLCAAGLDPAVGYLHRDRPGRPGLALDLMEELRPVLADRLALTLVNLRQVQGKGFIASESGAVTMDDDTRKAVLTAYQKRKDDKLQHPYLQEEITLGILPHIQALLLARHIRGDLDEYPPFIWR